MAKSVSEKNNEQLTDQIKKDKKVPESWKGALH